MAGVILKDVSKSFGPAKAIHNVNLCIEDGEFTVFVGPSGCGKSTLLRIIAGLETVSYGDILIAGKPVTQIDAANRGTAMVFQNYALYPHMNVRRNLGFALNMKGLKKNDVAAKVDPVAEMLRLQPLMDRKPAQLSGGQRQRVAIGRALVRSPKVFLFDEPLSNLDAELRVQLRVEIAQLHEKIGITMVYVTHDQVEAMTLAQRIVVLRDGRIEQVGRALDVFDNPNNVFVAGFIGSPKINLIDAKITNVNGNNVTLEIPGGKQLNWSGTGDEPHRGGSITLGIRPEHVIQTSEEGDTHLTVEYAEHLGTVSYIHGKLPDGGRLVLASQLDRSARKGDVISIRFPNEHILLFRPDGLRMR